MTITADFTLPPNFLETQLREEATVVAEACAGQLDRGENAEALASARRYRNLIEAADALRDEAVSA